jgi:hypothetical protein
MLKPDSTLNGTKTGKLWRPYSQDRVYHCFFVIVELPPLSLLKFAILPSLISKLMVIGLDDRMMNTHNGRAGHENAQGTGTRLLRQVWLKRSLRSLSPATSRTSCCGSSWPTPLMGVMVQEMLPLQLRPPTATSRPLTRRSSPRQENLLRLTTVFG